MHPLSKIKCLDIVAHALGRLWQENPFQFEANNLGYKNRHNGHDVCNPTQEECYKLEAAYTIW